MLDVDEPIRIAYLIWRDPWMTIGGDTFISDVLARAGLVNVFAEQTRYPEVTLEELAVSGAEAMLLSSEPYPFRTEHIAEVEAATGRPVLLVDGEACSWYGSRMRSAPPVLRTLRQRLTSVLRV